MELIREVQMDLYMMIKKMSISALKERKYLLLRTFWTVAPKLKRKNTDRVRNDAWNVLFEKNVWGKQSKKNG
tara:strand:- start:1422 stop:1637 length:216 start_codon:yes stop_codon:yes gene_type:complete